MTTPLHAIPHVLVSFAILKMNVNHEKLPAAELSSEFMANVYSFRETKEFTQLPNMIKQIKFESTVKSFGDNLFDHTMYPIQFLSNLCKKLMNLGQ